MVEFELLYNDKVYNLIPNTVYDRDSKISKNNFTMGFLKHKYESFKTITNG